jgi:hypothetical protein
MSCTMLVHSSGLLNFAGAVSSCCKQPEQSLFADVCLGNVYSIFKKTEKLLPNIALQKCKIHDVCQTYRNFMELI